MSQVLLSHHCSIFYGDSSQQFLLIGNSINSMALSLAALLIILFASSDTSPEWSPFGALRIEVHGFMTWGVIIISCVLIHHQSKSISWILTLPRLWGLAEQDGMGLSRGLFTRPFPMRAYNQ